MSIDQILKQALVMLERCLIRGEDAEYFVSAVRNIRACICAIQEEREKSSNDHQD